MFLECLPYTIVEYDEKIKHYKRTILNARCVDMMNNIISYDDYYKGCNNDYLNMVKTYNSFNNFLKVLKRYKKNFYFLI